MVVTTKTINKAIAPARQLIKSRPPIVISSSPQTPPISAKLKRKHRGDSDSESDFDDGSMGDRYEALDDEEALTTAWSFFNDCSEEEMQDITGKNLIIFYIPRLTYSQHVIPILSRKYSVCDRLTQ